MSKIEKRLRECAIEVQAELNRIEQGPDFDDGYHLLRILCAAIAKRNRMSFEDLIACASIETPEKFAMWLRNQP